MPASFKTTACLATVIAALQIGVNAIPKGMGAKSPTNNLIPRLETNYAGCTDAQKTKLQIDFADATALAGIAFSVDDQSATAITHYLRAEDIESAKSLWSSVAANNDPTNPSYTFSVRCAAADDASCKGGKGENSDRFVGTLRSCYLPVKNSANKTSLSSLAITDAQPQDGDTPREMLICPLFFTAAVTKNNLNSKKYDGDKRGSWCQTGQKFSDFETGGHTLLHEMTHLDALAKAAGLPSRSESDASHGTDDVDGFGDEYVVAARSFLDAWVNHQDELDPNALKPYQNAENIAAAATEW